MQQYDIAAKILIDNCRNEILRRFVGIEVRESTLIEKLPQETVSLKRSDYPLLVTDKNGITRLVLLEIQTYWDRKVPLNLLDYRTRYLLEQDTEAISCLLLLRPSSSATDSYQDNEVRFHYRLVKIYEKDGFEIIENGPLCLLPFVPLMKNGEDLIDQADSLIYKSEMSRLAKADMLTSMAILSGLISDKLPIELISRRKDIMIESAAYEIIRQDGFRDGIQQGILQGIQDGIRQVLHSLSESVIALLEIKFGLEGVRIYSRFRDIQDIAKLRQIIEAIKLAKSPEELLKFTEEI